MRCCDTCGAELNDAEPFAVCAKCLLEGALTTEERLDPALSSPEPVMAAWTEGVHRLFPRRNFAEDYDLLELVAEGGWGEVWKTWDFDLRRCVALKRLSLKAATSNAAVYRFLAEAQIAGQLEHPGILPILDVGLDPEGRPFYATQLLPGTTLGHIWSRVRDPSQTEWTLNRGLELLVRVCDVIAHAHSRGVIHRDLKPSNILVGSFGDVRVIDWGSAHLLREAQRHFQEPFVSINAPVIETVRQTAIDANPDSPLATAKAGQPVTDLFMPPEILRGENDQLGPQTDIYSVGVILYELLAGRPPYLDPDEKRPDRARLRERILAGLPLPVRVLNPSVSRDLAAVCQKAMAWTKAERYATMEELGSDLRAVLEVRPVQARRPGVLLKFQKWLQRNAAHALLASVALLVFSAAFFIVRAATTQRDLAEQMGALRSAELAARSGHWREALRHWAEAEAAGYPDKIHLGLRRAEAWTVLLSPRGSAAELAKLLRRSDLGDRRGAVLLRVGEHELFDESTASRGVEHVREALAAGLSGADQAVAKGLLAESTPAALELFREALRFDPYHHSAHRHSLGLEFLLGRHEELENHIRVFSVLFPDDPSPGYLQAAELALRGKLAEAEACLAAIPDASTSELESELDAGLRLMAALAQQYDVEAPLEKGPPDSPGLGQLLGAGMTSQSPAGGQGLENGSLPLTTRAAHLPCIQHYQEAWIAARSLALPLFADPKRALDKVQAGWRCHPEALLPAVAASLLGLQQPPEGPKSMPIVVLQAGLFQMAADSPSVMPGLGRWARWQAAQAHWQLSRAHPTNSAARQTCLEHLRRAATDSDTSAVECRAYFDIAFELGELDLARALLVRWEQLRPQDEQSLRSRIQLELAAGAFASAWKQIGKLLAAQPGDRWALEQKVILRQKLKELQNAAASSPSDPSP